MDVVAAFNETYNTIMGLAHQVKYLLYRNFLIKRRNIKATAYEAISVLYFVAILAVLKKFTIKQTIYPPIKDAAIPSFPVFQPRGAAVPSNASTVFKQPPKTIGYVFLPGSNITEGDRVITKLENATKTYGIKFAKFPTEKDLQAAHKASPQDISIGLVMDINGKKNVANYTIKVPFTSVPSTSADKRYDPQSELQITTHQGYTIS